MKLHSFRIKNYKSIDDTLDIIPDKLTVLAGKNNSGKSATLEALYKFATGNITGFMVEDPNYFDIDIVTEFTEAEIASLKQFTNNQLRSNELRFSFKCSGSQTFFKSLADQSSVNAFNFSASSLGYEARIDGAIISNYGNNLENGHPIIQAAKLIQPNIAYVNGNRTVRPMMAINTSETNLASDASNIYSFFHVLRNNNEPLFNLIRSKFSEIFPEVETLSTRLLPNNHVQIDVVLRDIDSPVPLYDCGSGFTHVLTLLGLIYGEKESRLILFDEPQSFLHPSAEKALYDQVKEQTLHQIVFSTHSPILLNYPAHKSVLLLRKENGKTSYLKLEDTSHALSEIGVMNSDFAFANRVLFVEGETEYKIIPLLMSYFGVPQIGYNYVLIPLGKTGDEFKGALKLMERNAQMYQTLFENISERHIPYRILLDRDERKQLMIGAAYREMVILLKRRELENYFLIPEAIFHVLANELEAHNVSNNNLTVEIVAQELEAILMDVHDKKLFPQNITEPVVDVVGSRVLDKIFSKHQCTYSKPSHGYEFVKWLLNNSTNALNEVYEVLRHFLV